VALYVTDTHALVWYSQGRSKKLGRGARAAFERAETGLALIHVPALVLVEVLELVQAGKIQLESSAREWLRGLQSLSGFTVADLTADVVEAGHELYGISERSDRLIAATALVLGLPLITRDPEISAQSRIQTIW
jgi:PIN domain nuclease of toxin-antitoxin system